MTCRILGSLFKWIGAAAWPAVLCGAIDIGQGSDSVLVFTVAEELGLHPSDIHLVTADTAITRWTWEAIHRVTFMAGNATIARRAQATNAAVSGRRRGARRPAERLVAAHGRIFVADAPHTAMPLPKLPNARRRALAP